MKSSVFIFLIFLNFLSLHAQKCEELLEGRIVDSQTGEGIAFVSVLHKQSGQGISSDPEGYFHFHDRCPGMQSLIFSHISYHADTVELSLPYEGEILIQLNSKAEWLEGVNVEDVYHDHQKRYVGGIVEKRAIVLQSNKNMADALESIEGVRVLKTGSGVSKPIIHGMYGNRLTVVNRGVSQSGQQWGNDHGPEVDAFGARNIRVIKGAGVLAYDGNSLGNIVLIESAPISSDSLIHGEANAIFQSNGRGLTLNASLEKGGGWLDWRLTTTLKKIGDNRAPNYFLTNTGKSELDGALQLEKNIGDKFFNEFYISSFNTEIGILKGSHVGNLSDLEEAIGREIPFYTDSTFSYTINPPRQLVNHHLLKYDGKYFLNRHLSLGLKYAFQWDDRKEYDVRRGDRSDIPSLSLTMYTHSLELSLSQHFKSGHTLSGGYQFMSVDNTNQPETGVLPLIPDYLSYSNSLFAILEKDKEKWAYDIGLRFNLRQFDVVTISQSVPREIIRYANNYQNYALSASLKYVISHDWLLKLNSSIAQRSPEINELYSNGLHQGVAAIEEGNPDLVSEQSFKTILSIDGDWGHKWHLMGSAYIQPIDNYIFLNPQDEYRLTIRGAFPVYKYEQTKALIYGLDLSTSFSLSEKASILFSYSMVRGNDLNNGLSIINLPSDILKLDINYRFNDGQSWINNRIKLTSSYTLKQWRIDESQDFLAPPDAYFLLGLQAETQKVFAKTSLAFSLRVENMLNTSYRDYLNRMRYFADDLGINIQIGARFIF